MTLPLDLAPVILSSLSLLLLYKDPTLALLPTLDKGASLPCWDDELDGLQQNVTINQCRKASTANLLSSPSSWGDACLNVGV
jgi:hypothetical protein